MSASAEEISAAEGGGGGGKPAQESAIEMVVGDDGPCVVFSGKEYVERLIEYFFIIVDAFIKEGENHFSPLAYRAAECYNAILVYALFTACGLRVTPGLTDVQSQLKEAQSQPLKSLITKYYNVIENRMPITHKANNYYRDIGVHVFNAYSGFNFLFTAKKKTHADEIAIVSKAIKQAVGFAPTKVQLSGDYYLEGGDCLFLQKQKLILVGLRCVDSIPDLNDALQTNGATCGYSSTAIPLRVKPTYLHHYYHLDLVATIAPSGELILYNQKLFEAEDIRHLLEAGVKIIDLKMNPIPMLVRETQQEMERMKTVLNKSPNAQGNFKLFLQKAKALGKHYASGQHAACHEITQRMYDCFKTHFPTSPLIEDCDKLHDAPEEEQALLCSFFICRAVDAYIKVQIKKSGEQLMREPEVGLSHINSLAIPTEGEAPDWLLMPAISEDALAILTASLPTVCVITPDSLKPDSRRFDSELAARVAQALRDNSFHTAQADNLLSYTHLPKALDEWQHTPTLVERLAPKYPDPVAAKLSLPKKLKRMGEKLGIEGDTLGLGRREIKHPFCSRIGEAGHFHCSTIGVFAPCRNFFTSIEAANALYKEGKHTEAHAGYHAMVGVVKQTFPAGRCRSVARYHSNLAAAATCLKLYDEAKTNAEVAIAADPHWEKAHIRLAIVYQKQKLWQAAITCLTAGRDQVTTEAEKKLLSTRIAKLAKKLAAAPAQVVDPPST